MTRIFKKFISEYTGIPILVPIKLQEISAVKLLATKIHRESHSHINVHAITASHDPCIFSHDSIASETTKHLHLRTFINVMDHSRLLPGGPSTSEGPTVVTKVISSC